MQDHTSTTKSDVAWLIEKPQRARLGPPEYYTQADHDADRQVYGWGFHADAAMKFATQQAAQEYIDVHAIEYGVAVEHAWG